MAIGSTKSALASGPDRIPMFPHCCELLTPNNAAAYPSPVAVMIMGAGTIVVTPYGRDTATDVTLTITSDMVTSGPCILPFMVRAVKATGTTATPIYGLW